MTDNEAREQCIDRYSAINDSKQVEFYSQGVAAWFNSALEHDKSLLTLSVAGIGVLVSLMPSSINSLCSLFLYVAAILAFTICLVSVLTIYKRNKKHILDVIAGDAKNDSLLEILDTTASFSFFIAMLLSGMLGISSAITIYNEKGNKMANEKNTKAVVTYDSVNGIAQLKPANESFNQMSGLQRSFQGMSQLQTPNTVQPQSNTTTQTQVPIPQDSKVIDK